MLRFSLSVGEVALRYECDFIVQGDDGEITFQEVRAFDVEDLSQAIIWIENKIKSAPAIFYKANAVRLRHGGKVVWLKALGALHANRP
jgi:hypothetical protein